MKLVGVVIAGLLVLAGCGGSEEVPREKPVATATTGIDLAAACVQVQMVNDDVGGSGPLGGWALPTYQKYGEEIAEVEADSNTEAVDLLKPLSEQSLVVGAMTLDDDVTDASSEWATRYKALADACIRADAPIRRLS